MGTKKRNILVIVFMMCWLSSCRARTVYPANIKSEIPEPPTDKVLAVYLNNLIDTGLINQNMSISQAYLTVDTATDSYGQFWYFFFDKHEICAILNLSIYPNDDGYYANSAHQISANEPVAECFEKILDENLAFGLAVIGSESYPLVVLCAEDGDKMILYPEGESGTGIELDEDEIFALHCFEDNEIELQMVSSVIEKVQ